MIPVAHSELSVDFLSWINEQLRHEADRRRPAPQRTFFKRLHRLPQFVWAGAFSLAVLCSSW